MDIYELIGIIIGDGHILHNPEKNQYRLEIYGNANDDWKYYYKIADFIEKFIGRRPNIRRKSAKEKNSLVLSTHNKELVNYLINELGLPYGNKTYTIKIPKKFLNWRYSKHIIRGIFETDGSLYFSKSKVIKYPSYPRIEIKTVSSKLAFQLFNLLKERNFNIQIMKTRYKSFKIYLSGEIMLNKWIKEIGFSNVSTITKYNLWRKLGYYLPYVTLEKRKKLLKKDAYSNYYISVRGQAVRQSMF